MTTSSLSIKRESLESLLAALSRDVANATAQYKSAPNDVERGRTKRLLDDLFLQMAKIEAELKQVEAAHGDQNRQFLNWHSKLPRINFKEAVAITQEVIIDREES